MVDEGKDVTLKTLDVDDFMGKSFTTGPDGKLYQLPDQQFANLYWFRYDWFDRPELRRSSRPSMATSSASRSTGRPTRTSPTSSPTMSRRSTASDLWPHGLRQEGPVARLALHRRLAVDGRHVDKGIPNGLPVDEWGIRVEGCRPVGSSVTRGGGANSPGAVYALQKYIDWLKKYAPPEAPGMTFSEAGPVPGQGKIAQQIFWYLAFTAALTSRACRW